MYACQYGWLARRPIRYSEVFRRGRPRAVSEYSVWDWVIGRSDPHEQLMVLYHDDRAVCRVFRMSLSDAGEWRVEREDPDFHQRFVGTVSADRIDARTEASED